MTNHPTSVIVVDAARHANFVFDNAAYHQLGEAKITGSAAYVYNEQFREFVRMKAWIFLLIPGLEEYSNNPHKNGALAKTLYYLSLLLDGILETQRITIKSPAPNCNTMLAAIYANLPPINEKMTKEQIKTQVKLNEPIQICITCCRLVMVYYYAHKPNNASQWAEIDKRLRVLQGKFKGISTSAPAATAASSHQALPRLDVHNHAQLAGFGAASSPRALPQLDARHVIQPTVHIQRWPHRMGQANSNGSKLTLTARGASAAKPTRAHNVGLA
ncbi:hypothetical protein PCASD_25748 [Puccinia coronata f. sp. avenae]|uniref:Uncharacterized protein n=1 Tax=Puccinia coronata f. sp. avenae TaxID=200324 RepID=A0A2N5RYS4_9BASI|nr:hypothetical protein PCASD_25748 [Puccinia coronata f. sp. avenae]